VPILECLPGADRVVAVTLRDAAGAPVAAYTSAAELVAECCDPSGRAVLFNPAATWADPVADPPLGRVTLAFAAAQTAGLAPADYPLQLAVTAGGRVAKRPLGVLRIRQSPDGPDAGWLVAEADVAGAFGDPFAARGGVPLLIAAASAAVEDHCNRAFRLATVTESYDGGAPRLFLRRPPIQSVASVAVNGVALDNTAGTAWTLDPDTGELARGRVLTPESWWWLGAAAAGYGYGGGYRPGWAPGMLDVTVAYTGGYAAIPAPVRQATLLVVKHLAESARATGLYTSERIGDYMYQMAQAGPDARLPAAARMLLGPYRIPRVV
jgi:hypothetical protein